MRMFFPKILLIFPALGGFVGANEALDVLEGKKNAADVSLPPAAPGESVAEGESREPVVYLEPEWTAGPLDAVWARSILFEDAANPWVQQIAVTGFFEGQAAFGQAEVDAVDATPASNVDLDGSRTRRARLGARLRTFRNTDIEASAEFAGDGDYRGIERLSARTEFLLDAAVTYGKFRPTFTAEYSTEDPYLPYPDRSMLVNMLAPASTLGIQLNYGCREWDYGFGWFSGDSHPDLPGWESDGFLAINLGRTVVERAGSSTMRTRWHLDYIHNFDNKDSQSVPGFNLAGRTSANGNQLVARNPAYRHLLSTGITIDMDRYSFTGDFMLAKGESTAWGLTLGPSYWALPGTLKIVGRYHYADSEDAGGLVATMGASADPAFDDTPFFIGDEFHSFYLGANLHLYQDQMILMSGFEQSILKDEAGGKFDTNALIWHTGAKVSF